MLEINVDGIEGVVSVMDGDRPLGPAMHFTYMAVQRAAQAVMARVGDDHKVISCTYVRRENGELVSVCFVGKILEELGVPLDAMEFMNSFNHERRNFQEYRVTFSDKAFYFLDTLQAIQDHGYEWGVAYQLATSITGRRNFRDGETLIHV